MKLAFIENRYKTYFWDGLAGELRRHGHEIIWLVQNPVFIPSVGQVCVLPFPQRVDRVNAGTTPDLGSIRRADRSLNYFSGNDRHYPHYWRAISQWLEHERPDVAIGESTLFHELMVVEWCRRNGVPFLHPCMPGYPGGRHCIYTDDQKQPLGISKDVPGDAACLAMACAIRDRSCLPSYMLPPAKADPGRSYPLPRSLRDRLTILLGYLRGERFNTPAPWRKWKLDRRIRRHLAAWRGVCAARSAVPAGARVLLYPLQMQPEANLDVWGQKFRDQAWLVKSLAEALPEGWVVRVKANPKAKYELGDALMLLLRNQPNVLPVPLDEPMAVALAAADLVCTVTGTVAVECLLSTKPLAQLGPGVVEAGPGCVQLDDPRQIAMVARAVQAGEYVLAAEADRIALVRRLYATSFPGVVGDPMFTPAAMAADNLKQVAANLMRVLEV